MNIYFVAAVLGLVPQAYSFALQRRIFRGALASTTTVSKLSLADPEYVTLATPSGPMRTIILRYTPRGARQLSGSRLLLRDISAHKPYHAVGGYDRR